MAQLNPRRTALLVIDMQHGLLQPGSPLEIPGGRAIIRAVDALIRAGGSNDAFLTFTRMCHDYFGRGPYQRLGPFHLKATPRKERAQRQPVIPVNRDTATHAQNHRLAIHHLGALLKVVLRIFQDVR